MLLSKQLANEFEDAWRAQAADLLAQHVVVNLEDAETLARRCVEQTAFDVLAGGYDETATKSALAHAIHERRPPVDILEAAHQHLLSRRLHRTAKGEFECRSTRRRRRNQGIYYTPDYIAEYLTTRCLGVRSEPYPPRILDPACGCGRFLLTAARHFLHRGLPPAEIALALHGCDLDQEAVTIARRMLMLTLTPRASTATEANAISAALQANIVCRNSLTEDISWRSYSSLQSPASGLFNVILGNPPYRRELGTKDLLDQIGKTEFGRRYRAPRMDLWYYFLHRGIEMLAAGGRLGFIVGAYWSAGAGANRLIAALRETVHVDEIFQLDRLQVFPGVAGHHMMLILSKPPSTAPTTVRLPILDEDHDARPYVRDQAHVHTFKKTPDQLFRQGQLDLEPPADQLLERLSRFPTLDQLGKIRQGIAENPACVTKTTRDRHDESWQTGDGVFALRPEELERLNLSPAEQHLIRPYHDLRDLGRYYRASNPSLHLIYSTRETWPRPEDFPTLLAHLSRFRAIMEARRETRQGIRGWWQLHWPRGAWIWETPKLIALQMAERPAFVPACKPTYVSFSANVFVPNSDACEHLNYFAALLNSRLLWKWFRHHAKRRGVGLEINGHVLARAPIRRIDFSSPKDVTVHDRLVDLVDRLLALSQEGRTTRRPDAETQRAEIDVQIDHLIYDLYDLAEDDIDDVEAACQDARS